MTAIVAKQGEILAEKVAELLAEGCSMNEIAQTIGKTKSAIYAVLDKHPEALKQFQERRRRRAITEIEKNLDAMIDVRDNSPNPMARVKAAQAIEAMAGVSYQMTPAGINVNIFGDSHNVNVMSGPEMEALAKVLAKDLGQETERTIDAIFSVRGASGEGEGGDPGGKTGGAPVAGSGAESSEA